MRHQLAIALIPSALLVVIAGLAFGFGWKATEWAEARIDKFPAIRSHANAIDQKAGLDSNSPTSATAMAVALKAGDDVQIGFGKLLESLGVVLLVLAGVQAVVTVRLAKRQEPSNPTVEGDALKSSARPSL